MRTTELCEKDAPWNLPDIAGLALTALESGKPSTISSSNSTTTPENRGGASTANSSVPPLDKPSRKPLPKSGVKSGVKRHMDEIIKPQAKARTTKKPTPQEKQPNQSPGNPTQAPSNITPQSTPTSRRKYSLLPRTLEYKEKAWKMLADKLLKRDLLDDKDFLLCWLGDVSMEGGQQTVNSIAKYIKEENRHLIKDGLKEILAMNRDRFQAFREKFKEDEAKARATSTSSPYNRYGHYVQDVFTFLAKRYPFKELGVEKDHMWGIMRRLYQDSRKGSKKQQGRKGSKKQQGLTGNDE